MQEQIDLMILERVANGFFELVLEYSANSRDIEREYKSRGFKVRSNEKLTTINWSHPHLDRMQKPNTRIFSYFTAQQLYYVLTQGKDLRALTSAVIYERLIREKQTIETYGMQKSAVFNLFSSAIEMAQQKGFIVVINDDGVLSCNKNIDFDIDEVREVDKNNIDKTNNWDDIIDAIHGG